MIKVENLSMLFSTEEVQTKALNEVTFEIEKGEFVAQLQISVAYFCSIGLYFLV